MQTTKNSAFFNGDRPIERLNDDRLARRSFAESVAGHILAEQGEHGFAAAVIGEWGSGKTSVLNMIAERLKTESEETVILQFNPWLFRGTTELVARFFEELSAQIGAKRPIQLQEVARLLATFGQLIAPHIPVPGAGIAEIVAGLFKGKPSAPLSLHSQRDRLGEALRRAKVRVVVFVDDIDRLEYGETRELMRLVRLTSDLPYLSFLLAFDREHVAKSFDEIGTDGQLFLDKIVQLSFDLPTTRQALLQEMFRNQLAELIDRRQHRELDKEVWQEVYSEIVRPLLSNPRDVKRYLYSLPATLDLVGKEIALADLLGMEAVRVLRPRIFGELRKNRENIVRSESSVTWIVRPDGNGEGGRSVVDEMLERSQGDNRLLRSVLVTLFPETRGMLGVGRNPGPQEADLRRHRRIGCEEVLKVYLNAGLAEYSDEIGVTQKVVDSLEDEVQLTRLLSGLHKEELEETLERLEDFEVEFQDEKVQVAVPVIVNLMHKLPDVDRGAFGIPPRSKVNRVLYRLMESVENPEYLRHYLREILPKIHSLSGKLEVIELVGHPEDSRRRLIDLARSSELEEQFIEELISASSEELEREWNLAKLCLIPFKWVEGERRRTLTEHMTRHMIKDTFVLAVLRSCTGHLSPNNGSSQERLPWQELTESFGGNFEAAVDRLANSESFVRLQEGDQATILLAQRHAAKQEPWEPEMDSGIRASS